MTMPTRHDAGRLRDRMMPVDVVVPCATPRNLVLFDDIIRRPREGSIEAAKKVCRGCGVRAECLAVNGHDYEAGVVAGLTNQERADRFGGAA